MNVVVVRDPVSIGLLLAHPNLRAATHDNLVAERCCCRVVERPPNLTGDSCRVCGGMMVRTGSCTSCSQCGESGGCG